MGKNRTSYIAATLIALCANYSADRATKWLARAFLEGERPISLFGGTVVLAFIENSGAFLGLGADWPQVLKYSLLLMIPIGVCVYGLYYAMFRETALSRAVVLTTIIGGGLSNLVDRLFNDFKVVDFLNFGIGSLRTGILNVADLSVTFGAIALLLMEFAAEKKTDAPKD